LIRIAPTLRMPVDKGDAQRSPGASARWGLSYNVDAADQRLHIGLAVVSFGIAWMARSGGYSAATARPRQSTATDPGALPGVRSCPDRDPRRCVPTPQSGPCPAVREGAGQAGGGG
jgi:hypothetical protein